MKISNISLQYNSYIIVSIKLIALYCIVILSCNTIVCYASLPCEAAVRVAPVRLSVRLSVPCPPLTGKNIYTTFKLRAKLPTSGATTGAF